MSTDPIKPVPAPRPNVNDRRPAPAAPAPAPTPAAPAAQPPSDTREDVTKQLPPLGTRTLTDILDYLCRPFHLGWIELKPGATTKDKTRALALAYVDTRIYQKRLDFLAGVGGWSAHFEPWGPTRIICRLTILGVTKEATGEGSPNDENCGTIAEAQAFKRACSAFGCGRYLYDLPSVWAPWSQEERQFVDPVGAARQIYEQAGLLGK